MILSKENIAFWATIENDLVTCVPSYVKNILYLNSFKDALTIRLIDAASIKSTENFVRTKLANILVNSGIEKSDYIHFVGPNYIDTMNYFEFSDGDHILLQQIAKYVADVIQEKESLSAGLQYFKRTKSSSMPAFYKGTYGIQCGNVFTIGSMETFKRKLFEKVGNTLNTCEIPSSCKSVNFSPDMVSVQKNEKTKKVFGLVTCGFCTNSSLSLNKKYSVSLKIESETSNYWVISNFMGHLSRAHGIKKYGKAKVKIEKTETPRTSEIVDNIIKKQKRSPSSGDQVLRAIDDDLLDGLRQMMRTQIEDQVELMEENTKSVPQELVDLMKFTVNGKSSLAAVIKTAKDGNCLFRSLAHQIFDEQIGSQQLDDSTIKLRSDVADFLNNNLCRYTSYILPRLFDINQSLRFHETDNENEYRKFVELLKTSAVWGGKESIQAVSEIYNVNIIIINEVGTAYSNDEFSMVHDKTVLLAHRLGIEPADVMSSDVQIGNNMRNHYDSVVVLCDTTISDIVDEISLRIQKKNNAIALNNLTID